VRTGNESRYWGAGEEKKDFVPDKNLTLDMLLAKKYLLKSPL